MNRVRSIPILKPQPQPPTVYPAKPAFRDYLRSIRPLHWIKNIFVFVPFVFSGFYSDWLAWLQSIGIFVLFSLSASAVYLINDSFDRDEDRCHPVKKLRPIAAGILSLQTALKMAVGIALVALTAALLWKPGLSLLLFTYIGLNGVYSWVLKKWVIIDVLTIAAGFLMRVYAGALAIGYTVSYWIYLTVFLLSALVALSKRRYEIIFDGQPESSERGYSPYFLDLLMVFNAASLFSVYTFYIIFRSGWQNGWTIYCSIPVVFFGITRYLYVIYQTRSIKEHTTLILTDIPLLAATGIWTALWIIELYWVNPSLTY